MSDLQEALERLRAHAAINADAESPYWRDGGWDRSAIADDTGLVSDDYLRLTDPTPLTEQVLRARGFVGELPEMWLGNVGYLCKFSFCGPMFYERFDGHEAGVLPPPRNVGELEQLLRRVNGGEG